MIAVPLVLLLSDRERTVKIAVLIGSAATTLLVLLLLGDTPMGVAGGLLFLAHRAAQVQGTGVVGLLYHPSVSLPVGLGPGTFALGLAGLVVAAGRRRPFDAALGTFLVVYLLSIGFSREVFFRYTLPMLPALAILGGGVTRLGMPRGVHPHAFAALAALLVLPSAAAAVQSDVLLSAPDTRALAGAWMQANLPPGSELVIDSYWSQPFYDSQQLGRGRLNSQYLTGDPLADSFQLGRYNNNFAVNRPAVPCYQVLESVAPRQTAAAKPAMAAFLPYSGAPPEDAVYDPLDSFYLPLWGFGTLDRAGPAIAIVAGCP